MRSLTLNVGSTICMCWGPRLNREARCGPVCMLSASWLWRARDRPPPDSMFPHAGLCSLKLWHRTNRPFLKLFCQAFPCSDETRNNTNPDSVSFICPGWPWTQNSPNSCLPSSWNYILATRMGSSMVLMHRESVSSEEKATQDPPALQGAKHLLSV